MKIEYNNLYTHFIFTTLHREPTISEIHRERIEKYITGILLIEMPVEIWNSDTFRSGTLCNELIY